MSETPKKDHLEVETSLKAGYKGEKRTGADGKTYTDGGDGYIYDSNGNKVHAGRGS
jgi:hypothetical protein